MDNLKCIYRFCKTNKLNPTLTRWVQAFGLGEIASQHLGAFAKNEKKRILSIFLFGIEIKIHYWSILECRSLHPVIGGCSSETQICIIDSRFDVLPLLFLRTIFLNCTFADTGE